MANAEDVVEDAGNISFAARPCADSSDLVRDVLVYVRYALACRDCN
jgi:hypothetical protein